MVLKDDAAWAKLWDRLAVSCPHMSGWGTAGGRANCVNAGAGCRVACGVSSTSCVSCVRGTVFGACDWAGRVSGAGRNGAASARGLSIVPLIDEGGIVDCRLGRVVGHMRAYWNRRTLMLVVTPLDTIL